MDQYSREFIAEKARLRPEDLGLVRTARRSHNQLGLAYQIAFIRLTGRAPGQQPFEILEDLVGYVATELNANPRDLDLYARRQPTLSAHLERVREHRGEIDRVLSEAGSDGRTISTSSYCPISARSGGTTSSSTASTSSTAVSCEAKGLAYKFARFWALPFAAERSLGVLAQLFAPLRQQRGMDFIASSNRRRRGSRLDLPYRLHLELRRKLPS